MNTSGGYFQDDVIFTSNIERAQMIMTSAKRGVIIEGPKGCGKTTLCCTLYQLSKNKASSNFDCIFLTSSSFHFDYPSIFNYFNRFLEKHKDHLEHFKPLGTAGKSNFHDAISMVTQVSGKIKLYVFVDISLYRADKNIPDLLNFVTSLQYSLVVISVSSGTRHQSTDYKLTDRIMNIVKTCKQCIVTGFTKEEAEMYFESVGRDNGNETENEETQRLSLDQVYPFTGYNPCLLSLVKEKGK